ncbi:hypothetical protein FACS1894166_01340 [Bacilli bacterium]|nr:hypothetical protein FACS1894166_01340 [Bacilli bacterium]
MKQRIKEVIVVEGKTDTAKLQSLFDVTTIETNGSHLSQKTVALIQQTAARQGVILFLDPDGPGESIRRKLENAVDKFKSAFIIRKAMGKHHKVGIAEADDKAIIKAIKQAATFDKKIDSLSWHEYSSLA